MKAVIIITSTVILLVAAVSIILISGQPNTKCPRIYYDFVDILGEINNQSITNQEVIKSAVELHTRSQYENEDFQKGFKLFLVSVVMDSSMKDLRESKRVVHSMYVISDACDKAINS